MSEFHDDYPQYEMMAHHSEEHGKVVRKKLWRVFWIMLGITLLELVVGFKAEDWGLLTELRGTTFGLKFFFVLFTIVKAGYIVMSFMHLGDEKKSLKWVIIAPYVAFIVYLAAMASIGEGSYSQKHRSGVDPNVLEQSTKMKTGQGGHHDAAGHDGGGHSEDHNAEQEHNTGAGKE